MSGEVGTPIHGAIVPIVTSDRADGEGGDVVAAMPHHADPVHLARTMSVDEAFDRVAHGCAAHIAANLQCAYEGREPEGVHQLRVGIRRLRAALSVFRNAVPQADSVRLRRNLRWLQGELGPAREWDVFIDHLAAGRAAKPGRNAKALMASAQEERTKAYGRVRRALRSRRCASILAHVVSEPMRGAYVDPGTSVAQAQPIRDFAASALRERQKRVLKLTGRIGKLDPDELHVLRIRVKRLRYAVEFFADLWPGKLTEHYVATLADLQDVTGQAEDAIVALGQLDRLGTKRGSARAGRVARLRTRRRLKKLRKKLMRPWRRFAALEAFWRDDRPFGIQAQPARRSITGGRRGGQGHRSATGAHERRVEPL